MAKKRVSKKDKEANLTAEQIEENVREYKRIWMDEHLKKASIFTRAKLHIRNVWDRFRK